MSQDSNTNREELLKKELEERTEKYKETRPKLKLPEFFDFIAENQHADPYFAMAFKLLCDHPEREERLYISLFDAIYQSNIRMAAMIDRLALAQLEGNPIVGDQVRKGHGPLPKGGVIDLTKGPKRG